jgi:hypothetical protein
MVDMASISAAVTGLKTATDIAKGLMDLKTTAEVQGKVIELQGVILAAQSSALAAQSDQFTLLERIRELEREMAQLEAWDAEKKRYKLKDYGGGTFAYELKPEEARGEPMHRVCAACYQKRHIAILQFVGQSSGQDHYRCLACKTDQWFGIHRYEAPRRSSDDWP